MTQSPRAETFPTITSPGSTDPSPDDLARVRARLAREPDGDVLAEALGFVGYESFERLHSGGLGVTRNSPRRSAWREAMWGGWS